MKLAPGAARCAADHEVQIRQAFDANGIHFITHTHAPGELLFSVPVCHEDLRDESK